MSILDWLFTTLPLVLACGIVLCTKRYMRSVADFMSGGRMAGRYLLAVAGGEMQAGAVVFVAAFEVIGNAGFTMSWWGYLSVPVGIVVAITGFVLYRFRETRAMTLAQFFEIRYSRPFRLFTGGLGFLAGICNFGIIPAVGARFLVYFLGLPTYIDFFSFQVPSYIPLMAVLLTLTLLLATSGGIITIMVTNCVEGILSQLFYLVIIAGLLFMFKWNEIASILVNRPEGRSMVNPFDIGRAADFNIWYVLMGIFVTTYGTMAWQNASAYNSAALTPHESRMGGLLGRWREMGKGALVMLLAICALTYLQHPDFSERSAGARATIAQITDGSMQKQMRLPIAVADMLPVGIKGLLCAVLIMGVFGGDATHLHSWGGIFVQDVILPLRKKPFTPKEHIRALRLSMIGVAVFAFLFGSLFRQTEYILMWWSVTTAIYVGGAGAAIVGGLYWKKGTTAGAWAALLTGSAMATGGLIARQVCGLKFPLNGVQVSFTAALTAVAVYIVVSLLTCKEDFNLERMLHRGKYALPGSGDAPSGAPKPLPAWSRLLGFDDRFTRGDKWIAGLLLGWSVFWFCVVVTGCVCHWVSPWSIATWLGYWHVTGIVVPIIISLVTGIWFTWGGARDIRSLFEHLKKEKICHADDGRVVGHSNLDEAVLAGAREAVPESRR